MMDEFQTKIWDFYHDHGRHDLPWRVDPAPYNVFVSEIMLQQTQVSRVLLKYAEWLAVFPDFASLAGASVTEVLGTWQGLGYNRRGLWLREAAMRVMDEYGGKLPRDPAELVRLKGVGLNTAGSMAAFAYNEPVVFIETNIRRVFIYHYTELMAVRAQGEDDLPPASVGSDTGFREGTGGVRWQGESLTPELSDADLLPLITRALDRESPREWYWALMDYGSDLAKRVPNPNRRSKHYAVQSKFEGSARQIRGEVLRQLLDGPKAAKDMGIDDARLAQVLVELGNEGFLVRDSDEFRLV